MSERFRELKGIYDNYKERKKEKVFLEHIEPSNENFFWLLKQFQKGPKEYADGEYYVMGTPYTQRWDNGTSNKAVRLRVRMPLKIEGIQVSTVFDWSDSYDTKNQIEVFTSVVKSGATERVGDLRVDVIERQKGGENKLLINHLFIDGKGSEQENLFGSPTGVLSINEKSILRILSSAYKVAWYVAKGGRLPSENKWLAMQDQVSQSSRAKQLTP